MRPTHHKRHYHYIRALLGLMLLISFSQSTQAQYFSKRYPLTTASYISSIQIVDDTIYAMCEVVDADTPHIDIADFVKFDKYGNLLSQSPFKIPGKTTIGANTNNLIRTNDGGFAYGGWTTGHGASDNSIFIVKYDRFGTLEWYRDLPDTNYLTYYSLAFIQDAYSNYYFAGSVTEKGSYKNESYITKTDSGGNLIYMRVYVEPAYRVCGVTGISINYKGNVILNSYGSNANVNNYNTGESHFIMYELDTSGTIINHRIDSNPNGPNGGPLIVFDGNKYIASGLYTCFKDTFNWFLKGSIVLLDSNFHVIWEVDTGFCSDDNTALYGLYSTPDSNFIALGLSRDLADTLHNHINGWILKFSRSGQIIWNRLYHGVAVQLEAAIIISLCQWVFSQMEAS